MSELIIDKITTRDGSNVGAVVVADIDELLLLNTNKEINTTAIVKDSNRGGVFNYDGAQSGVNNGGTVFNGWVRQYDGAVNVKWFGAKVDGVTDDTASINLATISAHNTTGNGDLTTRRTILIPAGDCVIDGTVYVHKGQLLTGAGEGVTNIMSTVQTGTGRRTFLLGYSETTQDGGGLPPIIEKMSTIGGDTSGAVIESFVAGSQVRDMFITSCGVGIRVGSDCIVTRCIIDQGLNGILLSGQNVIISDVIMYVMNYGLTIASNTYDCQINNCHFEYGKYNDITFADASSNIQNVSITNCQFLKNEQYATLSDDIAFRGNGANALISGCTFRNSKGYGIALQSGIGNEVKVIGCVFNGNKTNPAYAQSLTSKGINARYGIVTVDSCDFKNLNVHGIQCTTSTDLIIKNCNYSSITSGTSFIYSSSTAASIVATNNTGDNLTPLIDVGTKGAVVKGNIDWLGAFYAEGGRTAIRVPLLYNTALNYTYTANSNLSGNHVYRKNEIGIISKQIEFNGAEPTEYLVKTVLFSDTTFYVPQLDVQIDFDTVGDGLNKAYGIPVYLVVSVPSSYAYLQFSADTI